MFFLDFHSHTLDSSLLLSLSACTHLTRLDVSVTRLEFGKDVCACPQLLALWLPHVTELACNEVAEPLPLLEGLGPQLTRLESSSAPFGISERHAAAVRTCVKLRSVSLGVVSDDLLEALASLPLLADVHLGGVGGLEEPCPPTACTWQQLRLDMCCVSSLAKLPLPSIQQLVVGFEATAYVPAEIEEVTGLQEQIAAIMAVPSVQAQPSVPGLEHCMFHVDILGEHDAEEDDPETALDRLHATIQACMPLIKNRFHAVSLSINAACEDVNGETAGMLGTATDGKLVQLQVCSQTNCYEPDAPDAVTFDASFWEQLPICLPNLERLVLQLEQPLGNEGDAAFDAFVRMLMAWPKGRALALNVDTYAAARLREYLEWLLGFLCDALESAGADASLISLCFNCDGQSLVDVGEGGSQSAGSGGAGSEEDEGETGKEDGEGEQQEEEEGAEEEEEGTAGVGCDVEHGEEVEEGEEWEEGVSGENEDEEVAGQVEREGEAACGDFSVE